MAIANLNAHQLRTHLVYDASTGIFTRRCSSGTAKAGDVAGWKEANGYIKISVGGRKYYAHRCALLYVNGAWPQGHVDHIDGDRANNSLANLRIVSMQVNIQNMRRARKDNITGFLGVSFHKAAGKFMAECKGPDGRRHYLGLHATAEAAHSAYLSAKRQLHEGCTI